MKWVPTGNSYFFFFSQKYQAHNWTGYNICNSLVKRILLGFKLDFRKSDCASVMKSVGRTCSLAGHLLYSTRILTRRCAWKQAIFNTRPGVRAAPHYLPTALHQSSWAKGSCNHCRQLTRHWMCSIQQQELKTSSKLMLFLETGWEDFHRVNKSCRGRAADLLCLRKLDPSDMVTAIKPNHLLLITGRHWYGMVQPPCHVCSTELGPSRRSLGPFLNTAGIGLNTTVL